jgi:hypothetical protein
VISYSPTEHGRDGLCAISLYPREAKLSFGQRALLSKSDPNKLLQGSGTGVRYVPVSAAADLDRADIQALMAAATKLAKVRLDPGAKGSVIIRAEAQKKRAAQRKQSAGAPSAGRRKPGAR